MTRIDVFRMIRRRAAEAALLYSTCCHTFRATGITTYLQRWSTRSKSRRTSGRIPAAGHWIQQERPGEINELLIAFLKGL